MCFIAITIRDNIKTMKNPAEDRLESMNSRINYLMNDYKRTISSQKKKLWKTIKNLSGSKTNKNRTAIEFGDGQHIEGKMCHRVLQTVCRAPNYPAQRKASDIEDYKEPQH